LMIRVREIPSAVLKITSHGFGLMVMLRSRKGATQDQPRQPIRHNPGDG